jgi:hypothetical protein
VILFFLVTAFTSAAALPDAARLLPPETIVLFQAPNFSELAEQFKKTSLYGLYADPEMAPFVARVRQQVEEKMEAHQDLSGFFSQKLLPQGRAAIAFIFNDKAIKASEPSAFVLLDWGANTEQVKKIIEESDRKSADKGEQFRKEVFQGIEIVTDISKTASEDTKLPADEFSYCFIDQTLLGAEDIDVLKFVLAHARGASSGTLADDAGYSGAVASTGPDHDVDLYINLRHLMQAFGQMDETGKTKQTLSQLGLDNISSFAYSLGVARRPGCSLTVKAWLKVNGDKKGLLKMLDLESGVIKAPPFLSSSVYSVTFVNLNISKIIEQLGIMAPQYAAALYMPLPASDGSGTPGPQVKADLVDHLGSQIVVAQSINKAAADDSVPVETLIAAAVNNRSAVDRTLSFLHKTMLAPGRAESSRQLLGHTIYLVNAAFLPFFAPPRPTSQDPAAPSQPQMPSGAIAVTDTHLLVGSENTVERAIRMLSESKGESLSENAWFRTARADLPSLVGMAVLQDNASSAEVLWNLLKESASSSHISTASIAIQSSGMAEKIDFSLLPAFEKVKKYFGPLACYGVSKPEGFFFEASYQNSR